MGTSTYSGAGDACFEPVQQRVNTNVRVQDIVHFLLQLRIRGILLVLMLMRLGDGRCSHRVNRRCGRVFSIAVGVLVR